MINRFRLYHQNRGTASTVIWLFVLGYLIWMLLRNFSTPVAAVMLTAFGLCLLAPLAIMPICERYPARASRVAQGCSYLLIGYVAINYFNVFQFPGYVYFIGMLAISFYFGWTFWFFSSPAIFTGRRVAVMQDRFMAHEEAELEREIEAHERLEREQTGGV
jgi:hypothetical protein